MWWMIKGSFWFSLVLVLLPVFNAGSNARLANAPPVDMSDAMTAATGAYAYLSNLCTEKPDVCEKGSKTFTALGYRAKEGARVAYDYLNEKFQDDPAAARTAGAAPAGKTADPAKPALAATLASLKGAADAEVAVNGGVADQPMPDRPGAYKPQAYRAPQSDRLLTGSLPSHVPVPLERPTPSL